MGKYLTLAIALFVSAAALAATDFRLRFPPNPPRYLKQIPLNEITQRDLLDQLGIPQSMIEIDNEVRWQYDQVNPENSMRLSFTYVLVDGVVTDVIYNATGCGFRCPFNGITARKEQGLD
jgi:hypothetical protein